jgi:hypothetical protein
MEKHQITRQELVAAALKLGAQPGTIRAMVPPSHSVSLADKADGIL